MEKSLMEKLRNGNCDEIDKDMIVCRVSEAMKKVLTLCSDFQKNFKELQEEYDDELKIGKFAMVMAVSTCLDKAVTKDNGCGLMGIVGGQKDVIKLVSELTEKLAKQ